MRWQRHARAVIVIFGLVTAAALYHFTRDRPVSERPRLSGGLDPTTSTEAGRGSQLSFLGNVEQYRLDYGATRVRVDGRIEFDNAHVIFKEDGTEVWADRVEARGVTGSAPPAFLNLNGNVRLRTGEGATVEGESAVYENATGVTRIPGKVSFTRGRFSGTGTGAVYERAGGIFRLLADAHVVSTPVAGQNGAPAAEAAASPGTSARGTGEGPSTAGSSGAAPVPPVQPEEPVDCRSDSLTFNRAANALLFDGNARINRGDDQMTSERATMYLTDDGQQFRVIELRGRARVTPKNPATSKTPLMRAQDIDLAFYDGTEVLQRAVLSQQAHMEVTEGGGTKQIDGQMINLATAPDGRTMTHLEASSQVVVQIPPSQKAPGRRITSNTLLATGKDEVGLTDATFQGGVLFVEEIPATRGTPAGQRKGSGQTLVMKLKGNLDAIDEAQFQQNAQFSDGEVNGRSDIGTYLVSAGRLRLQPDPRAAVPNAHVTDGALTVDARRSVEIDLNTHDVVAQGNVQTRDTGQNGGGRANGGRGAAPARKGSAILDSGETTYGFGEEFQYTRSRNEAIYRGAPGAARVKQGETDIHGTEIVLNDRTRDLRATGQVTSTMPVEPDKASASSGRTLYTAKADSMVYQESAHTVTYVGKPVVMTTPDAETRAPTVVLKLNSEGRKLEQMDATSDPANPAPEQVTTTLAKGDRAWTESFNYDAALNRYTFRGRPFRLQSTDASGTCSESIGNWGSFIPGGEVVFPREHNPAGSRNQPCSAAPKK